MNETQITASKISVKDQFDLWQKEAESTIGVLKENVNALMTPIQESLKNNCIENIPANFGTFLYSCLGDRVVGQTKSVVNKTWLDTTDKGKFIKEKAEQKKCSVDEYLEKHDYHTDYNGKKIFNQTQAFLTAGRRFGVSYVTGCGDRSHTIYFEDGSIFYYMTQEHIDCIPNKAKKECCQAFLDYRNEFIRELNNLNDNNIMQIGIPVRIAKMTNLTTQSLFNRYEDRDNDLSGHVIEHIHDDVVEMATISTPHFHIWNKTDNVCSSSARGSRHKLDPCFSVQFGSMAKGLKVGSRGGAKITKLFCNVDISVKEIHHSLMALYTHTDNPLIQTNATDIVRGFNDVINQTPSGGRYYGNQNTVYANGIVLNMTDLINHPAVQNAINVRLDFFKVWSTKLQELKHANAGMYFLNSD